MGISTLLLHSPGVVFSASGGGDCCWIRSSSKSPLFGRPWPLPPRVEAAVHIDRRFVVAAVRNEFRGEEKRREEKQKSQLLGVATVSIGFNTVLLMSVAKPALPPPTSPHKGFPLGWLSLPLLAVWGAILVNAFVQYRILERLTCFPQRAGSTGGRVEVSLNERVVELEENAREFVATARGLSKQVEKLGVRFRATKRTLRDPMMETATIARKASEITSILTQREDRIEEELRGLQSSLLAMQEHQVKQLALISLTLKRTQNTTNITNNNESQAKKKLSNSVNGSSGFKTSADSNARSAETARDSEKTAEIRGAATARDSEKTVETRCAEAARDIEKTDERASNSNGTGTNIPVEGSLSKIDFWKDSSASSSSAVVEKMVADKSNLGRFFNGRKRTSTAPAPSERNAVSADSESQVLPDAEFVEQPDYDSDSWLR